MFPFVTICSSQSCPVSPMQKTHHDYSQGKQKALFRCKCMLIKTSDSQGLLFGFVLIKKNGGEKSFAMQTRPDSKDMQSNFKMHTGIRAESLRTTIHSLFFHKK